MLLGREDKIISKIIYSDFSRILRIPTFRDWNDSYKLNSLKIRAEHTSLSGSYKKIVRKTGLNFSVIRLVKIILSSYFRSTLHLVTSYGFITISSSVMVDSSPTTFTSIVPISRFLNVYGVVLPVSLP